MPGRALAGRVSHIGLSLCFADRTNTEHPGGAYGPDQYQGGMIAAPTIGATTKASRWTSVGSSFPKPPQDELRLQVQQRPAMLCASATRCRRTLSAARF
jgi:hypothetical protein